MQKLIKTRTSEQCRGHHRKVEALCRTRNLEKIIEIMKDNLEEEKKQGTVKRKVNRYPGKIRAQDWLNSEESQQGKGIKFLIDLGQIPFWSL